MRNAVMDAAPAVTVALAAVAAAWPAYAILCRAKPGRARSSVAYLLGFFTGLAATWGASMFARDWAAEPATVVTAGMLASFVGPFVGLVHAKLRGPVARRRARRREGTGDPYALRQF